MKQEPAQQTQEYTSLAKWLHWLVASLILVQYILIELAEKAEQAGTVVKQLGLIANHKSIGISILALAIVRLAFRFFKSPPSLPSSMPKWQVVGSHLSHGLLYVFLFALPLTGWMMSSASAYSVSWFNFVPLPDLVSASESNADILHWIHELLAELLVIVAALHVGAALKHHFIDRDTVLTRMTSRVSTAIFISVTILALLLFGGLKQTQKNGPLVRVSPSSVTEGAKEPLAPSQLATWKIDYQNSHVKFTGQQAGAPFTGEWKAWNGELQFDEQNLNDSRFLVKVDINSVFSNDTERDDYIKSADFFDVLTFPEAIFSAQEFNLQINSNSSTLTDEKKFVATGTLQIKDTQHPVQLTFTTEVIDNNIRLEGKASLDRHKWNIGVGDWSDPTWVGSNVSIDVLVNASIK